MAMQSRSKLQVTGPITVVMLSCVSFLNAMCFHEMRHLCVMTKYDCGAGGWGTAGGNPDGTKTSFK